MWLNLKIDGIKFVFRIRDYQEETLENRYYNWTVCDLHVQAKDYIDYKITNQEIFLAIEIEKLLLTLKKVVNGEKLDYYELNFIEPDLEFTFEFYEGNEYFMDVKVNFWYQGALTANYLNLSFSKEEIGLLMMYLEWVVGKRTAEDASIQDMLRRNELLKEYRL